MSDPNPQTYAPTPFAEPATPAAPSMSTPETLTGIFFEPERTFEALRARPRFLIAALVTLAAFMAFFFLFIQRMGLEEIARAQMLARNPDMTAEQLSQGMRAMANPVVRVLVYLQPLIGLLIVIAAGAGLYLLGTMAMAKTMSYRQALSVWVYSSLPPTVLLMILNIIILFLRPPEGNSAIAQAVSRGLVQANPSLLVNASEHPVLATALAALDLFAFYGLFLAALGLRKVARLSSGSAWAIVLTIWLIGVALRIALATAFGSAS